MPAGQIDINTIGDRVTRTVSEPAEEGYLTSMSVVPLTGAAEIGGTWVGVGIMSGAAGIEYITASLISGEVYLTKPLGWTGTILLERGDRIFIRYATAAVLSFRLSWRIERKDF